MTDGDTFVLTSNAVVSPDYVRTFPLAQMLSWLGDPFETVRVGGVDPEKRRRVSPPPSDAEGQEPYVPRTELGRRLWEIRKRAVAAGEAPVSWEEIERELADLRRGPGDRWE